MAKIDELDPKKQAALFLLLEYAAATKQNRKPLKEIAEKAGISDRQLFRWRSEDKEFIDAYDHMVTLKLRELQPRVVETLESLLMGKQSVKACELVLKTQGRLVEKQVVDANINANVDVREKTVETRTG